MLLGGSVTALRLPIKISGIKVMLKKWISRSDRKQAEAFVSILRGMDGADMGMTVALTYHQAARFEATSSLDFFNPVELIFEHPTIIYALSSKIVELQKSGDQVIASSLMPWLHTFRATQNPDIRLLAREMWGHLERGFPHAVMEGRAYASTMLGIDCDLSNVGVFPTGFTPKPL